MSSQPQVVMIAGPNGAGKTTASASLLKARRISIFVNADQIALGLSGMNPEIEAIAAGRLMLQQLHDLVQNRANFAFETTLAARSFAPWMKRIVADGYLAHLDYFWLETAEMAVNRVIHRKRSGGHFVEADVVRRRYVRGLENFFEQYRDLATSWTFWNNSIGKVPIAIAERLPGQMEVVHSPDLWRKLNETYGPAKGGTERNPLRSDN